jgi:hypothetical protein
MILQAVVLSTDAIHGIVKLRTAERSSAGRQLFPQLQAPKKFPASEHLHQLLLHVRAEHEITPYSLVCPLLALSNFLALTVTVLDSAFRVVSLLL